MCAEKERETFCTEKSVESVRLSPTNFFSSPSEMKIMCLPVIVAEYGIMMSGLTEILEKYEGALKRMKSAFESISLVMKEETCIALMKSEHYEKIRSVQEFFRELGRYWNHIECSLLDALVRATKCKPAIEELNEFVCSKKKDERIILSDDRASQLSLEALSPNQVQEDSNTVSIAATVNRVGLTMAVYERLSNIISYALGIPRFMMRLFGFEQGSIVISWATSRGVLSHIQSRVLEDHHMKLLLQEMVVSIRIGSEYNIAVGDSDYWINVSSYYYN